MPAGFQWIHSLSQAQPVIRTLIMRDTEILSEGELVNLNTGEVEAAGTGDAALMGAAAEDKDNTADGETCDVIVGPRDSVYEVEDNNARVIGATLDIAGGGLGVTGTANADLIVVEDSTATEKTRVMIAPGEYWLD